MSFADTINAQVADETAVDDFRRKGCPCPHCKRTGGDPTAVHNGSGAPLVKHPSTGRDTTYARPSSFGKPLEDTYRFDLWSKRTALYGAAVSPAIVAKAAQLDPKKDKAALDALVREAFKAARGEEAADLGTALHGVVERLNRGEWAIDDVPEVFRADAEAYLAELDRHGLAADRRYVECRVVNDTVRAAGTFDLVLGRHLADLKSGQSVDTKQVGIAVQLAIYRHGLLYDVAADERSAMPDLDDELAIVVHLPYGSGQCTLIDVDLRKGWEAAQLARAAKDWNYRKDLFAVRPLATQPELTPVANPDQGDAGIQLRTTWIRQRVEALSPAGREALLLVWPEGVAKGTDVERTHAELDLLAKALDQAEAAVEAPFGPPDPTKPVVEPRARAEAPVVQLAPPEPIADRPLTEEEADDLIARVKRCPTPEQLGAWATEALAAGLALTIRDRRTLHAGQQLDAALMCAPQGDELARVLIHAATGIEPQPVEATGALFAALTIEQAHAVKRAAKGIAEGRFAITFADDGAPVVAPIAA